MAITVRHIKVAPVVEGNIQKKPLCLCEVLAPILYPTKIAGIFPLESKHYGGRCAYRRSWFWIAWNTVLVIFYTYQLSVNFKWVDIMRNEGFMQILRDIINLLYLNCNILLVLMAFVQIPKYTRVFQKLSEVFERGMFCQSGRRVALKTHYIFLGFFILITAIEVATFSLLSNSIDHETDIFTYYSQLMFSQNISLTFHITFLSMMSIILGTLACFERTLRAALHYVPLYPIEVLNEYNNQRILFGIYKIKLCSSDHSSPKYSLLTREEIVEYMRILHEDICLAIHCYNDCMDPTLLLHTVLELVVLIIEYYAIIVYMVNNSSTEPLDYPNHCINCLYCVLHTVGLFVFLKNGQHISNMITALRKILLEYSTRITDDDEYRQIRIFIEKLKQHRPLTASGVFNIDLSIASSIYASILTYVLVALQFEIPK